MKIEVKKEINFSSYYKKVNIVSIFLIIISIFFLLIKGLNFGVDFKGGTLIEIRTNNSNISISDIRKSLLKMDLGDVTVKEFGKKDDYLIKIEKKKKY